MKNQKIYLNGATWKIHPETLIMLSLLDVSQELYFGLIWVMSPQPGQILYSDDFYRFYIGGQFKAAPKTKADVETILMR